jgi:hypothetical protein
MPLILLNRMTYYHVHIGPLLDCFLRQLNPIHLHTLTSLKYILHHPLFYTSVYQLISSFQVSQLRNCTQFSSVMHATHATNLTHIYLALSF